MKVKILSFRCLVMWEEKQIKLDKILKGNGFSDIHK